MTRNAPTGARHSGCLDHVQHDYVRSGWLCITTTTEDARWPRVELYRPQPGAEGPYLPAPERDTQPVDRAADMRAFADHVAAVAARHRAAELERLAQPVAEPDKHPRQSASSGTGHLPFRTTCSHTPHCQPVEPAPVAEPVKARKPRKPAPIYVEPAPITAPEPETAVYDLDAPHPLPDPVAPADALAPEPVRHLTYADRPSFTYCAQPHTAGTITAPDNLGALAVLAHVGGFCELCIEACARALAPEPVAPDPAPVAEPEPVSIAPAPAAPVLELVQPATTADGRPTCPRCGQVFRKHGTGLAWHLANRPDCAGAPSPAAIAS